MKKYKTLWEKLSKEHKELIEQEFDKYPNSTQALMDELKANYGSTYITLDKAISLGVITHPLEPFSLDRHFRIFDPNY